MTARSLGWIAAGCALAACGRSGGSLSLTTPRPAAPWCELGSGVFALQWQPSVEPRMVTSCYRSPSPGASPAMANAQPPAPSTLAELTVPPGAAIELPVTLPAIARGMRCRLDSLMLAHGQASSDLAISLRVEDKETAIVEYAAVPAPFGPPSPEGGGRGPRLVREPGATAVPAATAAPPPPPPTTTLELSLGSWFAGATITLQTTAGRVEMVPMAPPRPITLVAVRHELDLEAPDSFSLVLRARTQPFVIGVRSEVESQDPRLGYVAPGETQALPTSLIPQAAVVLTHCQHRADTIFSGLRRH